MTPPDSTLAGEPDAPRPPTGPTGPGTRRIVHIAFPRVWETARTHSLYTHPSLESEGFIHCSTPEQLAATAARHFSSGSDLILLELDPRRLGESELIWEASGDHGVFPHVYGPIPTSAVVAQYPWNTDEDLPPQLSEPRS